MFTSTTFEKIICVQLFDVIERAWKQEKQRQFSTKANKYDTLITVHTHTFTFIDPACYSRTFQTNE